LPIAKARIERSLEQARLQFRAAAELNGAKVTFSPAVFLNDMSEHSLHVFWPDRAGQRRATEGLHKGPDPAGKASFQVGLDCHVTRHNPGFRNTQGQLQDGNHHPSAILANRAMDKCRQGMIEQRFQEASEQRGVLLGRNPPAGESPLPAPAA